jgi:hypothetical protein
VGELLAEVRQAWKFLNRQRGASVLAVVCLGVGIGMHTSMFASADPWLFRPLPYAEPERLAAVREVHPGGAGRLVSVPSFLTLREQAGSFADVGAVVRAGFNLSTEDEPERIAGAEVTPSLFSLLGVRAAEERLFDEAESHPGGPAVCLIGDALWRRHFREQAGILGRAIKIDGRAHTIVGRMPVG